MPARRRRKAGGSFETFCIEQILLHVRLTDPTTEAYFYRTHGGVEVDLVLRLRGRLVPIEIKLGTSPPDTTSLERCCRYLDVTRGYVVNLRHDVTEIRRGILMTGLRELLEELRLSPPIP